MDRPVWLGGAFQFLGAGILLLVFVVVGSNRYDTSHDPSVGETVASIIGFLIDIGSFLLFFL
jgi:hypothetical protein